MGLLDTLRTAVKIADKVTKPIQATVTYERCLLHSGDGTKTYASAVEMKAIVDWKRQQVRTPSGVLSLSRASVMFIDILALNVATSGEGLDDHDRITLPDGTTGPILDMSGFVDAGTGRPLATEVFLG